MEKQYDPIDSSVGRDSSRVMLMPRAANCSSSSSRPPGWSSRWKSTTVVLSAPVGSGSSPGRATSTNRVTAACMSPMSAAVTRFVLVARPGELPEPTGADKTTVVLFQRDDHAGGLLALLEQFAARGINMTRLESRPTKESMGSYCFSIDLEGHVLDERVGEALMGLRRICAEVRFLGSYPRADRQRASIAPLTSDTDFTAARSWLRASAPAALSGRAIRRAGSRDAALGSRS